MGGAAGAARGTKAFGVLFECCRRHTIAAAHSMTSAAAWHCCGSGGSFVAVAWRQQLSNGGSAVASLNTIAVAA